MIRQISHCAALVFVSLLIAPVSMSASGARFIADSFDDRVDALPGDGVCADDSGHCTLRAAVMETNALPGDDLIELPPGFYALGIAGTGEDGSATGDLDIRDDLTITGVNAVRTVIDGGVVPNLSTTPVDRVFHIFPNELGRGPTVRFRSLTIQHGNPNVDGATDRGGAIEVGDSQFAGNTTLILKVVNVRDSTATFGGGIFIGFGGSLVATDSTIGPRNSALMGGGVNARDDRPVQLTNCTVSGNTAAAGGGGIATSLGVNVVLNAVTVANNTALYGAGIQREIDGGPVLLRDSIVADNHGGDCSGSISTLGNNLASDGSCFLNRPSDLPYTEPLLYPLALNSAHTPTHALMPGSPAVEHIPLVNCVDTDQRLVGRPLPINASACDIGAFESAQ